MNVVVDTSVLLALFAKRDDHHLEVASWLADDAPTLFTTPLILAELDHLLSVRAGTAGQQVLWDNLENGALGETWWPEAGAASARVAMNYSDTGVGLADASLVALAEHVETTLIATLDERHFRVLRPLDGSAFTLLPADRSLT